MRHLSVKIPESLYQQLKRKAQAMGNLKVSEALRILLCAGIDTPILDPKSHYELKTYALIHEAILSLVEDPDSLINRANQQAKKLAETMLKPPDSLK